MIKVTHQYNMNVGIVTIISRGDSAEVYPNMPPDRLAASPVLSVVQCNENGRCLLVYWTGIPPTDDIECDVNCYIVSQLVAQIPPHFSLN